MRSSQKNAPRNPTSAPHMPDRPGHIAPGSDTRPSRSGDQSARRLLSGHEAIAAIESRHGDLLYLTPDVPRTVSPVDGWARIRSADSSADMFSGLFGAALTGMRTAGVTGDDRISGLGPSIREAVRQHTPAVLYLAAGASHDAYTALGRTGALLFYAADVQEAADLAYIARRASESALVPAVCAIDATRTADALQTISLPDTDDLTRWLGSPSDEIAPVGPAQTMMFGDRRRRVPRSFDPDSPLGLGALREADFELQADAARAAFFTDQLPSAVDRSMREFAELTGRRYERVSAYRMDDADVAVLAQGAITRDLRAVVDHLRSDRGIRAGCLSLLLFRPFPSDLLASLLRGVAAVTILEKSTGTPIQLRPLYRDVRVMIDAADTGELYSGTYGGGRAAPSFEDLCGVFLNMTAGEAARRDFVIGARFEIDEPRLPAIERMQRQMRRLWPTLMNRVLAPAGDPSSSTRAVLKVRFEATPEWDGRSAARLFAEGVLDALGGHVEVRSGGDERPGDPCFLDISRSEFAGPSMGRSTRIHVLLATHPELLAAGEPLSTLAAGATVCTVSDLGAVSLWRALPAHVRRTLRERDAILMVFDAAGIARETAPDPRFEPLLMTMAAAGVAAAATADIVKTTDTVDPDAILRCFLDRVDEWIAGQSGLRTSIRGAVERGLTSAETVRVVDFEPLSSPDPEPGSPWPLKQLADPATDGPADPARFWKSVGYPVGSGARDQVLADPFLASGAMPARSSAGHRPGAVRSTAPALVPERCTACGMCWSLCPDAALAATVQEPSALLQAAVDRAEADGHAVFALRRVLGHVADAAARLAADDELHRFTTLGPLLLEAWNRVLPRLGLSDEKRREFDDTFARVLDRVETFPIARPNPFAAEGLLLSIAVDVDACTSCALCVQSCPDDALEMRGRDAGGIDRQRVEMDFLRELPEVPLGAIEPFVTGGDSLKPVYRLLNRRVRDTMLGGESGGPGDGTRTALHLTLAAAEATVQPRVDAFRKELRGLRDGLDERIRELLTGAVEVNDLEALTRRLSAATQERDRDADHIGLSEVDRLLRDDDKPHTVNRRHLELLTRIRLDVDTLLGAYEHASHGDGRARLAAAFGTSDASGARSTFPWNPYPFPWIFHLREQAPSIAEGLYEGVQSRMMDTFRTVRTARQLVDRTHEPGKNDEMPERPSRDDLTPDEIRLCPPVIAVVDEPGPAVDRLLRSRLPITVLHIDTDRYGTDGRELGVRVPDESALRAVAAGTAFVVQSSASVPDHLLANAGRAFEFDGPALISVHAHDPAAHGIRPQAAAEQAYAAVTSRTTPLFTYDPDRGSEVSERLDLGGNPSQEEDLATVSATVLSATGRLVEATWPLTFADWAAGQDRFRRHFTFAPRPDWHDDMIPIATYMDLPEGKREHLQPYVQLPGPDGRISRWIPSGEVLLETQRRVAIWNVLRELAGVKSGLADRIRAEADARADSHLADEQARLRASFESRLSQELDERERTHAARYHRRLKEELLHLSGFAGEGSHAGSVIRDYLREKPADARQEEI